MRFLRRLVSNDPVGVFAVLWPLVFLAPLAPGLPRTSHGFAWRQEVVIGSLLVITLILLVRKSLACRNWSGKLQRSEIGILLPLALFVLWSVASLLWATAWLHTLHYNLSWGLYVMSFLVMIQVTRKPKLLCVSLGSLAIVLTIISIASAIEFWSTSPELYQFGLLLRRSTGLGEPLAVAVPMFTVLAVTLRKKNAAIVCGAAAVLSWLAVLQTLERAPLLGLGAATLVIAGGLVVRKDFRPKRPRRGWVLVGLLIATTIFQTMAPGVSSSFHRFQDWQQHDPNTQVRLLVWAISFEMLRDNPVHGVGANNFEIAYPASRAQFSARQPNSNLIGLQEELLAERSHNEYVQILAELGIVGFLFFILFCAALIWLAAKALRSARNPLALGAVGSLTAFAVSSGASSISFRWLGSGLLFFLAASIIIRFSSVGTDQKSIWHLPPAVAQGAMAGGLALALLGLSVMSVLGVSSTLRGMALAQAASASLHRSAEDDRTERLFRLALRWNPYDGPTHFEFGSWLDGKRRHREAIDHFRFATEHGFNSSICYASLAKAEAAAGENVRAQQTLATAVQIFPRSIFLRVRHAIALAEIGKAKESASEYAVALQTDRPAARGWRQLMCFGPDSAYAAAKADPGIAAPRLLQPQSWAYPASAEQAGRPPFAYPIDEGSNIEDLTFRL
jgi:O-antigen ligase